MKVKVWDWKKVIPGCDLGLAAKVILFNLSNYMNENGESCFPSIARMARDCKLTERCIYKHLREAEKAGFIMRVKRNPESNKSGNQYFATLPENLLPLHSRSSLNDDSSLQKQDDLSCTAVHNLSCTAVQPISHNTSPKDKLPLGSLYTTRARIITREEQGVLKNGKEVEQNSKPPAKPQVKPKTEFRIEQHLDDKSRQQARKNASGWDIYYLMQVYDQGVNSGKRSAPTHPHLAFPAWCICYTKGKSPGGMTFH